MPLNVRRYCTSIFLTFAAAAGASAQIQAPPAANTAANTVSPPPVVAPTSGDLMRGRISKAKAFIAVRNYNAAIYELENIRKESGDPAVDGVANVLLMNSYLEQGDYKRAQDLLGEFYTQQKTTRAGSAANYMAVAGQVIKGARSRAERYKALGLSVGDRTLPLEALNDLEKMRETLEVVITQSKEIGGDKAKAADGMALLEEATNSRSLLARDDYDQRRWKDEVLDTREQMASSRSVVTSAIGEPTADAGLVASNQPKPLMVPGTVSATPAVVRDRQVNTTANNIKTDQPVYVPLASASTPAKPAEPKPEPVAQASTQNPTPMPTPAASAPAPTAGPKDDSPVAVGSLVAYATKQTKPVYPIAAKSMRTTGIVKVEVTLNENGDVAEVGKTSGPGMLQAAARDAVRGWKFKPFVRDGQPVKATGFINFNFTL